MSSQLQNSVGGAVAIAAIEAWAIALLVDRGLAATISTISGSTAGAAAVTTVGATVAPAAGTQALLVLGSPDALAGAGNLGIACRSTLRGTIAAVCRRHRQLQRRHRQHHTHSNNSSLL